MKGPGKAALVLLASAAVALPIWLLSPLGGSEPAAESPSAVPASTSDSPSPEPSGEPFEVFVPPTHSDGDLTVLPVTFPDGSTAELAYPPSLGLAEMGVRPYWVGCGGDFGFFHYEPFGSAYEGEPLQTWTGSDGQTVGLWPGVKGNGPFDHLIWHFGGWTVEKSEYRNSAASSQEELTACAEGLRATITDGGWIVLDGPAGVGLPRGNFGPPEGAELQFGDLSPRFVVLWPAHCENYTFDGVTDIGGVGVDLSKDFAAWCEPGGQMQIHVYFTPGSSFFREVFDGLEVRKVTFAS